MRRRGGVGGENGPVDPEGDFGKFGVNGEPGQFGPEGDLGQFCPDRLVRGDKGHFCPIGDGKISGAELLWAEVGRDGNRLRTGGEKRRREGERG